MQVVTNTARPALFLHTCFVDYDM